MKIALLEFGALSSFNKIMNNQLTLFENNIIELSKFLNHAELDIYVLTDKKVDDKECVEKIKSILIKYNITLKVLHFWDDIKEQWKDQDQHGHDNYINTFNVTQYGYNENQNPHGYDCKKEFNAGNLWFRRYLNFHLFTEYNKTDHTEYDLICMTRLFSTKIIHIKKIANFDRDCLYYSLDNLFIGNYANMEKFFNFGKYSKWFNSNNHLNRPSLLDNSEFIGFAKSHDNWWGNHIFSSEIQILYYIYCNFNNYKNLRFNFPLYCDKHDWIYNLVYHNTYDKSDSVASLHNKDDYHLFIVISR
jgi:hypothetical protein